MSVENTVDTRRWYAVKTKPREEDRADQNLAAWGVETFAPRIEKKTYNQFTGKPTLIPRPLFPGYIFARFDADRLLHKVYYTRGVRSVVSFSGGPAEVEDDVIEFIRSRVGADGFIRLGDELKRGDAVTVKEGSLRGLNGIFDRSMSGSSRVMLLLTVISYQASVIVERELVQKTG